MCSSALLVARLAGGRRVRERQFSRTIGQSARSVSRRSTASLFRPSRPNSATTCSGIPRGGKETPSRLGQPEGPPHAGKRTAGG